MGAFSKKKNEENFYSAYATYAASHNTISCDRSKLANGFKFGTSGCSGKINTEQQEQEEKNEKE